VFVCRKIIRTILQWPPALSRVGGTPMFLPFEPKQVMTQTFFWPCNLPQERYNFMKPVLKKGIPVKNGVPVEVFALKRPLRAEGRRNDG